ncbi:MAG: hypothetical protein FK730_09700 [Asgard group archaeon]|nr:hypothetical protein [Asgard group archaeon]
MATESDKKSKTKSSIPISLADFDDNFCSNCMFDWCSFRQKVVYCSLKYKGVRGLICQNNNCKSKLK